MDFVWSMLESLVFFFSNGSVWQQNHLGEIQWSNVVKRNLHVTSLNWWSESHVSNQKPKNSWAFSASAHFSLLEMFKDRKKQQNLFAVQLQFFAVKHVKPSYFPLSELFCCGGYVLLQPLRFKLLGKSGPQKSIFGARNAKFLLERKLWTKGCFRELTSHCQL